MSCENPYARNLWFDHLGRHLSPFLDNDDVGDILPPRAYMLTIASGDYTIYPSDDKSVRRKFIRRCVADYKGLVSNQVNFIGMVEPGVYVSCGRAFGSNLAYNLHCHGIVWGCRPQQIQSLCKDIRKKVSSAVPGFGAVLAKPIKNGDLAQVLWYCTKFPNKQYQLWLRETGYKQYKRQINGVNAVRLYYQMSHIRLDDLTFGHLWGEEIKDRATRDYVSIR